MQVSRSNVGRADAIRCDDFLFRHSDYLDGQLSPLMSAQLRAHAESCSSCARYDRIVRRGLTLVHELPAVEPSPDFEQRLQHRIFHVQDEVSLAPQRPVAGAAALAVAAAIALLAWSPLLMDGERSAPTAADVTPSQYQPLRLQAPSSAAEWYTTIPVGATLASHNGVMFISAPSVAPGPYNPLVVQPPVSRAVRTVSRGSPD